MSSKNEIIGALTVERDKAVDALDKAIRERNEAREQIRRMQKRDRLADELDALDEEIEKNAIHEKSGPSLGDLGTQYYNPWRISGAI